jgi:hypothetical protein
MDVKDIVLKYLKDNNYDGLCNEGCGCGFDDFMPCSVNIYNDCEPAYKHTDNEGIYYSNIKDKS